MPAKRKPTPAVAPSEPDTITLEYSVLELKENMARLTELRKQGYTIAGYTATGNLRSVILVRESKAE